MNNKRGFTFIEVVVVMGVMALLFALTAPDLFKLQDRNSLQNTTTELVSLMRQQQFTAMNSGQIAGIHFTQSSYTLYTGDTFVPSSQENTVHTLSYPLAFSVIDFADGNVRFASGSGEMIGYTATTDTVILTDTVHLIEKSVRLNALGIPTIGN